MSFETVSNKTALVVVDMQNDFVREGAPMEVDGIRNTIAPIKKLTSAARAKNMPIIYLKFIAGPKHTHIWDKSPQIERDKMCWRGVYRKYKDAPKELLGADIVQELYPEEHDYIVEKYSYDGFHNTNLIDILYAEDIDTIIVVGTVTNVCVMETVSGAYRNNISVIVCPEGVSTYDEEQQRATLKNFTVKFGKVSPLDSIIADIANLDRRESP